MGYILKTRLKKKKLNNEAIEFTGLEKYTKMRPKQLSGGLLRRLNIACGIAHKPKLVIMDEPTVAVDPQSRNKILEGIQELNKKWKHNYLYITLYGRSRTDLYKDCNYRWWKMYSRRD